MNPLVIALGEKDKRGDDELSFKPGDVFESIPSSYSNNDKQRSGGWVQGRKSDGKVGWYQREYTEKMVKYRINQFGIEKQKNLLKEKRQMESLSSGYKVRAIVSRTPIQPDEIHLNFDDVFTKLEHEVEPGWSRGEKDGVVGVFPTGAVVKLFETQIEKSGESNRDTVKSRTAIKNGGESKLNTKPRVKFGNIHLTVRKQGTLKRKDTSDNLFLRNNWQPLHMVIAANYLMGFKSQKHFVEMSREERVQPSLIIDLNGSTIKWKEEKGKGFTIRTIFGAVWSFKGSSYYDENPWFSEIDSVIKEFISINDS